MKSCNITLAGLKGISTLCVCFFSQSKMFSTSVCKTWNPSQFLMADSNNTRIENGSLSTKHKYKSTFYHKHPKLGHISPSYLLNFKLLMCTSVSYYTSMFTCAHIHSGLIGSFIFSFYLAINYLLPSNNIKNWVMAGNFSVTFVNTLFLSKQL